MDACPLHSSTIPTSSFHKITPTVTIFPAGQSLSLPNFNKYPHPTKLRILNTKAKASGGALRISAVAVEASNEGDGKSENVAFVAGATGKVGSRAVRELVKLGFQVRAGVRSSQRAQSLVQSVKQMRLDDEGSQAIERLQLVECDLEKPGQIVPALGNASVVLCCIGASEKEVLDITGPYRIDYKATKNLIDAATVAKVDHFIMVSSLGTNKIGFPAAILNLFWGVLVWKRKAEEALIASGLPYTIVRPGGMERPTDAYKETHNITLSTEDTLFGGQVSNLQVAELIAFMARSQGLSYCKVVEVIAETTVPLTPFDKLLEKIPSQRVKPKKPDASPTSQPATLEKVEKVSTSPPEVKAPEPGPAQAPSPPEVKAPEPEPAQIRPLSPYSVYDDLKPPTSPTPTAPIIPKVPSTTTSDTAGAEPALVEAKIPNFLSPYAAYEDLKPPSSPCPTPPVSSKPSEAAPPVEPSLEPAGNDVAKVVATDIDGQSVQKQVVNSYRSPYHVYDEFKPPASPSPTPPSSMEGATQGNDTILPAAVKDEQHKEETKEEKRRPLSPYFMYEDMKPPTSPSPIKAASK
ncbi:Protein TIC 62, chloroplastic [Linum perenne]